MYYKEKVENEKLYVQFTPTGEWHEVSYEKLLSMYLVEKEHHVEFVNEIRKRLDVALMASKVTE